MANDSRNDDFPTIRLDEEDRREYQQKKQAAHTIKSEPSAPVSKGANSGAEVKTKSGAPAALVIFVALIALAACGGCYYLFMQLQAQQQAAQAAENRILQLEKKLSATGEEMGESTVALQVKVTELSNRTGELWEQMDKLWASAWRRNQKEITDLNDRVGRVETGLKEDVSNVSGNLDQLSGQLSSARKQLTTMADEVLGLNVQLEQAASDKQQQAQSVKNVNDKLSVLEQRNATLSGRISELENEIREIATKVVTSQPNSNP